MPDLGYTEINGRRYCKEYFMPNDEHELARQTLVHQIHLQAFNGKLTLVPLEDPTKILDIATGTGEWAIRMGELYPNCEVIGTDISAIQETNVPPNVFFEIDDAEVPWERPRDSFDLVHLRHTHGAFKSTAFVYQQAFDVLKSGGWIEIKEYNMIDHSYIYEWNQIDGSVSFPPDSALAALMAQGYKSSVASCRPWGRLQTPAYSSTSGLSTCASQNTYFHS